MYEAVHVTPDGNTTPARFVSTAAQYGYGGIVLCGEYDTVALQDLEDTYDITVVRGTTIPATDRDTVAKAIDAARADVDVLMVLAEETEMQRFVAQREQVDVLATGADIEHTTAKVARDNGIALTCDFGPLVHQRGADRTAAIRALRRQWRIIEHYDIPVVVTTHAASHLSLRAPREIRALGEAIGFEGECINQGLDYWRTIANRTKRNRCDRFIEPGVRIVDDEADTG